MFKIGIIFFYFKKVKFLFLDKIKDIEFICFRGLRFLVIWLKRWNKVIFIFFNGFFKKENIFIWFFNYGFKKKDI